MRVTTPVNVLAWLAGGLSAVSLACAEPSDSSDPARGLDLTGVELKAVYEADFLAPLRLVHESALLEGGRRVRQPPAGTDWVLEGNGGARVENGRLHLANETTHVVFWNTRRFPEDFLLAFDVSPKDSRNGLNIVFFAAAGRDGGSIFAPGQPAREGEFKRYHSGSLDTYHVSYWANQGRDKPRDTAHLRKNHGFHRVAVGRDFITGEGPGPHRVRILKIDGRIEVEVNGKLALRWQDDGDQWGPVLRDGFIGLRQMQHTGESSYGAFKVWEASRRR